MKWEILEQTPCYQGFFRLDKLLLRHSLFRGGNSGILVRELIQRADAVAVLPYDPERDQVVLLEQFRVGALDCRQGPWLLEIVAGLIDPGERRDDAAARETLEETGCTLQALHHLYDYYSTPGGFKERVSLYIGRVDASGAVGIHGKRDEDEDIRVRVMDREEAFGLMSSGMITSAQPLLALQWLQVNRGVLCDMWGCRGPAGWSPISPDLP